MKRWILFCALLMVVQVGLTVVTQVAHRADTSQSAKGPLLKLNVAEINELLLEDGEGHKLRLTKEKDRWLLPDAGPFPADTARVQGLLERLAAMQRGWPEATTTEAATRFKVAPARFERKLSLRAGGTDAAVVYFGTSPGLRKIYLRVDGDKEIEAMALSPHELEVKADSWIDTAILHLKPEQVARVELPGVQLVGGKDGLHPADLKADEEVVKDRLDSVIKRLTDLSITAILGTESKPEYGLETPALRYRVTLEGGATVDYLFGQPPQPEKTEGKEPQPAAENTFVLKVSTQEQLLRVDGWQVEELKNVTRTSLVRTKTPTPTQSSPEGEQAQAAPPEPAQPVAPPATGPAQ